MSANPFDSVAPDARAAEAQQQAAIDAYRVKLAAGKGPTVFFPFGKQQPLEKYAGMQMVPFRRNKHVDTPERILRNPQPGWHYGFAKRDDPAVRGKLRAKRYFPVYIDELIPETDAEISVSEEIQTERGPLGLVMWHGLMMVGIPPKTWNEEVEQPALQSAVRLTQHQESFHDFSMKTVGQHTENSTDALGRPITTTTHEVGGASYSDLRGKVETSMTITA